MYLAESSGRGIVAKIEAFMCVFVAGGGGGFHTGLVGYYAAPRHVFCRSPGGVARVGDGKSRSQQTDQ